MASLTLIFLCQLAGELLVGALKLPVPGPVLGMALLFVGLALRGGAPEELSSVADALLGHLSLLFVPAGVGVILYAGLIGSAWLAIAASLLLSTAVGIAVTGLAMRRFSAPATSAPARSAPEERR